MNISWIILLINISIGFGHVYKYEKRELKKRQFSDVKSIKQRIDHFNSTDKRLFSNAYCEKLDFWKPNGTIYVYLIGYYLLDFFIEDFLYKKHTYIMDLVKETNGALFVLEHRYYGESMPLDPTVTQNLKYLTSQQALADAVHFVETIRASEKFNTSTASKVVAIGFSYGGSLATWMRMLHPNLVDAVVASSALVLAKVDLFEYNEKLGDDYKKYGPKGCYEKIEQIFKRFDTMLKTKKGMEQLKKELNICNYTDLTIAENRELFFMHRTAYPVTYFDVSTPKDITKHCQAIMNSATSKLNVKAKVDDLFWNGQCVDYDFNSTIDMWKYMPGNVGSFLYQQCNEFGQFLSMETDKQPFTKNLPLEFLYKMCMGMFDIDKKRVDDGVAYTNKVYGGLTPNVTNVVFVNGEMDPYGRVQFHKDLSKSAVVTIIPNVTGYADLKPKRDDDSKELIDARIYIKKLVKKWIGFGA